MKLEYSRQIFDNYLNIKFHENMSRGSRVVPCGRTDGQTDRHDEANSAHTPQVQKITLPNTDYAHKNITSNFSQARSTLPEDGSQRIRNMSEFLIVF